MLTYNKDGTPNYYSFRDFGCRGEGICQVEHLMLEINFHFFRMNVCC